MTPALVPQSGFTFMETVGGEASRAIEAFDKLEGKLAGGIAALKGLASLAPTRAFVRGRAPAR